MGCMALKVDGLARSFSGFAIAARGGHCVPSHQQLGFLYSHVVQVDHGFAGSFLGQRLLVQNSTFRTLDQMDWRRSHRSFLS